MKELLLSLASGSPGSVRRAANALFAVGETSGADLAVGLFMTLHAELANLHEGQGRFRSCLNSGMALVVMAGSGADPLVP
jgi:hypothetical protein